MSLNADYRVPRRARSTWYNCRSASVAVTMMETLPGAPRTVDLAEIERPALEAPLEAAGDRRFHASQIFRWIYQRGGADVAAMTDLSRDLRPALVSGFPASAA